MKSVLLAGPVVYANILFVVEGKLLHRAIAFILTDCYRVNTSWSYQENVV